MVAEGSRRPVDDLVALAQARSGELSQAELKLLRAAPKGEVAFCGPSAKDDDPANDPAKADEWGHEREIRADLIRWLCVDHDAKSAVDPKGIRVHAARIAGALDLSFISVPFPLRLRRCRFADNINLVSSNLPALNLAGSRVQSLSADGATVSGDVHLGDGFSAEGEVRLHNARIGGDLDCTGGILRNPGKKALNADRADLKGSLFLRDGFQAEGEVRLLGAQVGSVLDCRAGRFKNPRKSALSADRVIVKGGVFLNDGFRVEGAVRLPGAQIGGNLTCSRGRFEEPAKDALSADSSNVKGSVFLDKGFNAEGAVRLVGAQIGGDLACKSGTFNNPGQHALSADGANVKGSVFLSDGFSADGEVRLLGAQIGGSLECSGGIFSSPGKEAIYADGADVRGDVFLDNGFNAEGTVRLLGTQIGGDLDCGGGTFKNLGQDALVVDRANVRGDIYLCDGLRAEGEVRLQGVQIGGKLDCQSGTFKNPGKDALSADGARVGGDAFLRDGFSAEGIVGLPGARIGGDLDCSNGSFSDVNVEAAAIADALFWRGVEAWSLDLVDASAGSLVDDAQSWPTKGKLLLDGFVYRQISRNSPRDAKTRLRWLERQDPFTPKPYRQLAKVLREAGDDSGARRVLFEMERRRRQEEDRSWYTRLWSRHLKWTIGYGFYSWWALAWLVLLTALGWGLFRYGYLSGAMAPTDKDAYCFFRGQGRPPDYYQRFTASVYSLENSLPFVNLGQKDHWTPDPNPQLSRWVPGFLRWFRWGQVLLGWLLATLFVAGVTGVVRKE